MSIAAIGAQVAPGVIPSLEAGTVPVTRLLRLSITDRCNFRCRYCMPAEGVPKAPHAELLSLERLAETVDFLVEYAGVERVKLTGGEPLVRSGIESLVRRIAAMPKVKEVSLTSNASLLGRMAESLQAAGLQRVNISLDSLDPQRFAELTRGGKLADALAGIQAAQRAGLLPIKLNAVLQRSGWEQDVPRLLDFSAENGFELRFIELMRTGTELDWCASEFVPADQVRQALAQTAEVRPMDGPPGAPAKLTEIIWHGKKIVVGWITPRSHPFCNQCERVRLDARGRLRRCLMDPNYLELGSILERGDKQSAAEAFAGYMTGKHAPETMEIASAMNLIGG